MENVGYKTEDNEEGDGRFKWSFDTAAASITPIG